MLKPKMKKKAEEKLGQFFPNIGNCYENLYSEQQYFIEKILAGEDVFGILSTGVGKTVCFQLPALVWEDSITIVIEPLVAVIQGQVSEINKHGTVAAIFSPKNVNLRRSSGRKRYDEIVAGKYRMIYISPEMIDDVNFRRLLREIQGRVRMIAVDEAHCVSTWGYAFRSAYLGIRRLLKLFDKRPIVAAFTATATNFIVQDVIETIGLKIHAQDIPNANYNKDNLQLSMKCIWRTKKKEVIVSGKSYGVREITPAQQRRNYVKRDVEKYLKQGKKGVIFCNSISAINDLQNYLSKYVKDLEPEKILTFYGDMTREDKIANLELFTQEKGYVMLCTNAFGMGVNVPDIEYIIHYNIPLSIIDYYQQIGRGARNRKCICECKLYYCIEDDLLIEKMNHTDSGELSRIQRSELEKERYIAMKNLVTKYGKSESRQIMEYIGDYYTRELQNAQEEVVRKSRYPVFINKSIISDCIINGQFRVTEPGVLERKRYKKKQEGKVCNYVRFEIKMAEKRGPEANNAWERLEYFDLLLADAVYSLWLGRMKITPRSIWMLLSGDSKISVQKEKVEEITGRLKKMSRLSIRIESDDLRYRHEMGEDIPDVFEGRFLPFKEELMNAGKYELETIPPFHQYAELHRDIQMIPGEWIDLKDESQNDAFKVNASIETVIFKFFLLERMKLLNSKGALANRIRYYDSKERFVLEKRGIQMYPQKEERNRDWDKYSYKRKLEEICGVPGEKKGKIEYLLDQYVKKKVIRGYKSSALKNEKIKIGPDAYKIKKYTQVVIHNYPPHFE